MPDDLLPPNGTPLTRTRDRLEARIGALDAPIDTLWDPWQCPADWLPWLAWAHGVQEWDDAWPEATKRSAVAAALPIRWHGGTVWAVREALRAAGYADAELVEGIPHLTHDGSQLHDGIEDYGAGARWALFKLIVDLGEERGVGGAELQRLLRLVERAKPVRSHLRAVEYRATVEDHLDMLDPHALIARPTITDMRPAGRRYDGAIDYDQAQQLDRPQAAYNGARRHDAWLRYDGLEPHHEWQVTGERHDNEWEAHSVHLRAQLTDTQIAPVRYDGAADYEGAVRHGSGTQPCTSTGRLAIRWRRKHNNRLRYDGAHHYAGSAAVVTNL